MPLGPTSDVSIRLAGEFSVQPSVAPDCSCVTIRPPPEGRLADGQPSNTQVPTVTTMASTCTALLEPLKTWTAPPSKTQLVAGTQPSKIVFGEPCHGVGKLI